MEVLLSVDIGTQSARAALVDYFGQVLASASQEYELVCPKPGWAEQNPDSWWNATVSNIRDILAKVPKAEVRGIAVGGQMHATVPVDGEGRLVTPAALLWCDKRSEPQCASIKEKADEDELLRNTGNPVLPCWLGPKIRWIRENQPDIYRQAFKFLTCKDYLNLRLTGEMLTDYSEASGSYLFDTRRGAWSQELCELIGVDRDKLPAIAESSQIIGKVTAGAAATTGLRPGTPVVCGGGDMLCLLLGAGVVQHGCACDVTGTAADISVHTPEPLYDKRLMNLHHVLPGGGWISFGILDAGGGSYKWFRDTFAAAEVAEARAKGISAYNLIDRRAAKTPPGAEGLFFLPYLLGERTLGTPDSRGVFFGLTTRHGFGHCARALMEGVTFDLRQTLEIIREKGIGISEIRAIGGAARSSLWCEIKTDIYSTTLLTLSNFEGGIIGGIILAGLGTGVYRDAAEGAARIVKIDRRYTPDPERTSQYERNYRVFKAMHDGFQPYFKQNAELLS